MKLKYENKPIWKVIGIVWLFTALLNLSVILLSINNDSRTEMDITVPLYATTFVLNVFLALTFLNYNRIVYIQMDEDTLSLYRGFLLKRIEIKMDAIAEGKVKAKQLVLVLLDGKKVKINHTMLSSQDYSKLILELNRYIHLK